VALEKESDLKLCALCVLSVCHSPNSEVCAAAAFNPQVGLMHHVPAGDVEVVGTRCEVMISVGPRLAQQVRHARQPAEQDAGDQVAQETHALHGGAPVTPGCPGHCRRRMDPRFQLAGVRLPYARHPC
jgi:hypothetical protein